MSPGRVLIVDDNEDFCSTLAALLDLEGFAAQWSSNARDGLAHLRSHGADVVILDMVMPGSSGDAFLSERAADEALSTIPVLIHTAHPAFVLGDHGHHAAVLLKPAPPAVVIDAVRGLIATRHGVSGDAKKAAEAVHLQPRTRGGRTMCGEPVVGGMILYPSAREATAVGFPVCAACIARERSRSSIP